VSSVSDKQFEFKYSQGGKVKFFRNDYRHFKISKGALGTIQPVQKSAFDDIRLA
jgi:hypothetical protein